MKYLFLSLILPLNSVFIGSEYYDYGAPSDAITCANEKILYLLMIAPQELQLLH